MTQPGRRESKKQETIIAVRDAALRLAVRCGVENVTIDQIAAEADIGVRTFFNYYPTKEDALVASTTWGADVLVRAYRARPREEPVLRALGEAVTTAMAEQDSTVSDQIEALRLIRSAPSLLPHHLAIMARYEGELAEAIAERIGPAAAGADDLYPAICAGAAIAALRIVIDRWLRGDSGYGPAEIAAFRADFERSLRLLAGGLERSAQR